MKDTAQHMNTWYDITKDIIIPFLGVVSTIIIGVIIAIILKRKEEKSKIKTLLIDTYMEFLNKEVSFYSYESASFSYYLFKDMYLNYGDYLIVGANSHIPLERIASFRDQFKIKKDSISFEETNWSPFTYKFSFLLGLKKYTTELQELETNISTNYMADMPRSTFIQSLKEKVKRDPIIVQKLNSLNVNQINDALDKIVHIIEVDYNKHQYKFFNPYTSKLADLIDSY